MMHSDKITSTLLLHTLHYLLFYAPLHVNHVEILLQPKIRLCGNFDHFFQRRPDCRQPEINSFWFPLFYEPIPIYPGILQL